MPWTCQACELELADNLFSCPECAAPKEAWTVVTDKTRAMVLSGARSRFEVRRGTETASAKDPSSLEFETLVASSAPALSKADALALKAAGRRPAPAHLLIARLHPREGADCTVEVCVDFEQEDVWELSVSPAHVGDGTQLDVVFLCVFGPEAVEGELFEGIHLLDVSEEREGVVGHAAEVEFAALGKRKELPLEAVSSVPSVELIELEDVSFGTGRKILLPYGWGVTDLITGLSVAAAVLDYARTHPDRRLVVAGHTDTSGSEASNLALSAERAQNVTLYLTGQRAEWAAHCQAQFEVADVQQVLLWLAHARGWGTDPGKVDNVFGPQTRRARDAFRERCNAERGTQLERGVKQNLADWEAIFDLYEEELASKLRLAPAQLPELRAGLKFSDPPWLACGEHWPTERPGANGVSSAANRRVDVLFFAEANLPSLDGSPPGQSIYEDGRYRRDYLDVAGELKEPEPPPPNAAETGASKGSPFLKDCPLRHVLKGA